MKIQKIINEFINSKGYITAEELSNKANITRQGAHKHLFKLVKNNKIIKIGKTRSTYYIPWSKEKNEEINKNKIFKMTVIVKNVQEDTLFNLISKELDLKKNINKNTFEIIFYAFTEMYNNVIEHSKSTTANVHFEIKDNSILFIIRDHGIGIFHSLRQKFNINSDNEALELLLKGKKTTKPEQHSGEGIFFTSKIADIFKLENKKIRALIDNQINDIFLEEIRQKKGTQISFTIKNNTKKQLSPLFQQYTNENFEFDKTIVKIKLLNKETYYISRSQAKRLLYGLDEFNEIILDFKGVKTVGQGFIDEVFRVYLKSHALKKITAINCNKVVSFMVERVKKSSLQ